MKSFSPCSRMLVFPWGAFSPITTSVCAVVGGPALKFRTELGPLQPLTLLCYTFFFFFLEMPEDWCHCLRLRASSIHPKPVFSGIPNAVSLLLQSTSPFDQDPEEEDVVKCHLLLKGQVHSDWSRVCPLQLMTVLTLKMRSYHYTEVPVSSAHWF